MKAQLQLLNGLIVEAEAGDPKELFKQLAQAVKGFEAWRQDLSRDGTRLSDDVTCNCK